MMSSAESSSRGILGIARGAVVRASIGWERFWFEPAPATELGVARAIFFAVTFALYLREDFSQWATVSHVFWMPIWLFRQLHVPVASRTTLLVLQFVWKLALAGAALGVFTRASLALSFALGFYLLGLPHNFGHTYHFDAVVIFTFGILACSRAGDAWSLGRLFRRAGTDVPAAPPLMSGEYRWPVRLVWLATTLVLFAAGVSKLRHSGLPWVFSDTMSIFLTKAYYHFSDANPVVPWGLAIASHPWLARGMAATSLAIETLFPLALFSRRARRVLVPGAFAMLVGIRLVMGPTFAGFLAVFTFWAPWAAIGARVAARLRGGARLILIYDGGCGLCSRTVGVVRGLDLLGKVEVRDVTGDWDDLSARFPDLDQGRCLEEMHVIGPTGRVFRGFDGYRALAWTLPAGWPLLPFAYLPGVAPVGSAVYRFVAAHRSRTCDLKPAAKDADPSRPGDPIEVTPGP